ncbi:hypothetical protein AcW1_010163 [Taiwanofungus camphoratus]|nr:hypothetical protein AcW1_010163 [Antrodia cinnamomea]
MKRFLAIVRRAIAWRRKLKEGREEEELPRPEIVEENALGIPWNGPLTASDDDLGLYQPSTGVLNQGQGGAGPKEEQQHDHTKATSTSQMQMRHWKKRSCYRCRKSGHTVKECPEPRKLKRRGGDHHSSVEADDEQGNQYGMEPGLSQPPEAIGGVGSGGEDSLPIITEPLSQWPTSKSDFMLEETQPYPCPPADYWGSEESDGLIELPMTGTP